MSRAGLLASLAAVGLLAAAPPADALTPEQEAALRAAAAAGTLRTEVARILPQLAPEGCAISASFGDVIGALLPTLEDPTGAAIAGLDAGEGAAPYLRARNCPDDTREQELIAMSCQLLFAGLDRDPYIRALFQSAQTRAIAETSPDSRDIVIALNDGLAVCPFDPQARTRLQQIAAETGFSEFVVALIEGIEPAAGPGAGPPLAIPVGGGVIPRVPLPSPDAPGRAGVASPS